HALALTAEGEELRRCGAGDPLLAAGRCARGELVRGRAGHGDAGEVALHVGDEHGGAGVRGLLGDHLQGAGLAGAGRAGDAAVTVEHPLSVLHLAGLLRLLAHGHGAVWDEGALDGVGVAVRGVGWAERAGVVRDGRVVLGAHGGLLLRRRLPTVRAVDPG